MNLFTIVSFRISRLITRTYSTSFSMAARMFDKETREAIYSIYGFVRIADEIVDTLHNFDKKYLLNKLEQDYYDSFKQGISLNPVLNSFQHTVKKYGIPDEHINSFLTSMKYDLVKDHYITKPEMADYVYGSADVVGLMCLRIFCREDNALYQQLEIPAMKLGSAFQKVNFLRDLKVDIEELGRRYFPELIKDHLDENIKTVLVKDIENDFRTALPGIKILPGQSRLAVIVAYLYYRILLKKIADTPADTILNSRIRVSNARKFFLIIRAFFVYKLKLI